MLPFARTMTVLEKRKKKIPGNSFYIAVLFVDQNVLYFLAAKTTGDVRFIWLSFCLILLDAHKLSWSLIQAANWKQLFTSDLELISPKSFKFYIHFTSLKSRNYFCIGTFDA